MEVTAAVFDDHTRVSHHHHHRAGPWGAGTSVTKTPPFLTDLTSLTEHHRLKRSLETQATKSIVLFCKMASSPKQNLLLHPLLTWELRTFPGTHSSPLVWHLNRERKVICQPADWVKENEVRALPVCSQSQKERPQKPYPNTADRNRERRKTQNSNNRWHWVGLIDSSRVQ